MSAFTGERLTRDGTTPDLWAEHVARYALAATFAPARRALDVGCGTGYGAARLSHSCGAVAAVDISTETIAAASSTYRLAANLRFATASAEALPLPAGAFDLVTAFEVIEHIAEWGLALDELARVVAPGGVALVSTPNREYYTQSRGAAGPNPFHIHEFGYEEFRDELLRRFRSVSILLQNWTQCLAFYPHRFFPPASCDVETTGGLPEQAHFFVALCSHDASVDLRRSYVHVPRGANLLREREIHIASLEAELASLIRAYQELNAHLESQNRWGLGLSEELDRTRGVLAELQRHLEAQNRWALDLSGELDRLRAMYADVQADAEAKAHWGLALSAELDALRVAHTDLHTELEERTRWALALSAELETAKATLAMTRQSRWVRLGRLFRLGPDLGG